MLLPLAHKSISQTRSLLHLPAQVRIGRMPIKRNNRVSARVQWPEPPRRPDRCCRSPSNVHNHPPPQVSRPGVHPHGRADRSSLPHAEPGTAPGPSPWPSPCPLEASRDWGGGSHIPSPQLNTWKLGRWGYPSRWHREYSSSTYCVRGPYEELVLQLCPRQRCSCPHASRPQDYTKTTKKKTSTECQRFGEKKIKQVNVILKITRKEEG